MFLSVGLFDLFHTLSYKGMTDIITSSGVEKAIYFWLAGRAAQNLAFAKMAFFPNEKEASKSMISFYLSMTFLVFFSLAVFHQASFLPRVFIAGEGLTKIKIYIEYAILSINLIAGIIFYQRRLQGEADKNLFLANSAFMLAIAQFTVTLYSHHDDLMNFSGHVLKTVGYIYIYRGILARELIRPYDEIDKLKTELKLGVKNFKALETEHERAQKIATLGTEVGRIAHDLNNILTIINVNIQSIMRSHSFDEVTTKKAENIKSAVKKSSGFLQALLNFSRNVGMEKSVIDVAQSLRDIHSLLMPLIGKNIKLNLLSEADVTIWATDSDLHQIVLNLVVNARDAIGQQAGVIDISASTQFLSEDIDQLCFYVPKGIYAVLTVTDNGSGISPENMEKIFEPFFTTKPVGVGTGIGLSTVKSIVTKNNGYLFVKSQQDKGTTFSIYLPKHHAHALIDESEKKSA